MPAKTKLKTIHVCSVLFMSMSAFGETSPQANSPQANSPQANSPQANNSQESLVTQDAELEVLTVEGRALSLYQGNGAVFATRTNSDIDKIPQTVQIITQELIEDQAAYEISDLFRSMSGVSYLNSALLKCVVLSKKAKYFMTV